MRVFDDQDVGAQFGDALLDRFAAGSDDRTERGATVRETASAGGVMDKKKAV